MVTAAKDVTSEGSGREAPSRSSEFLIFLSLLSLLAALVFPSLQRLVRSANESSVRQRLGSLRLAVRAYRVDHEDEIPKELAPLMRAGSPYLRGVCALNVPEHGVSYVVETSSFVNRTLDNGVWGYVNSGPAAGTVYIQCTHRDSAGKAWNEH